MVDRLALLGIFVLLSSESFLTGLVGGKIAATSITMVVAALAFRALVIRPSLSGQYRAHATVVLRRAAQSKAHLVLLAAFAGMFLCSFGRAAALGTLPADWAMLQLLRWASIIVFLAAMLVAEDWEGSQGGLLRSMAFAFLLYSALNVLLYLLGVRNTATSEQYISVGGRGLMFGLIGLDVYRTPVPIGGGINTGGLESAAGIAMGLIMLTQARGLGVPRIVSATLAGGSAFLVLLTDSRGAMGAALIGAGIALLLPGAGRRHVKWLALAIPILPLVALVVLQAFGNLAWISRLGRTEGTGPVALLSGRPVIWGYILTFLGHFKLSQVFGYGALGQVGSGVSQQYWRLFATMYASPLYASAHNTLLQTILDVGYAGAIVQTALFWTLLRRFGSAGRPGNHWAWDGVALGLTVFLAFLGTTDQTLNTQMPNTLVLFLMLNLYALATPVQGGHASAVGSPQDAAQALTP